jgi:GT2 family glycosyltransferase
LISVIIVNYHSAALTKKAVHSVFASDEETEVVVVDNSATEEERERLGELRNEGRLTLILNSQNEGFAKACNRAYERAQGDYIFLLNPDASLASSTLASFRKFFDRTENAGAVSPQTYWDDEMNYLFPRHAFPSPLRDLVIRTSSLTYLTECLYSFHERRKSLCLWKAAKPLEVENLHGGVVMLRRTAIERAGGLFDERFFLFYEDTDLFLRLRRSGYKLYVDAGAKAVHNYSHTKKKLDMMERARRLYYEKHFRGSILERISLSIPQRLRSDASIDHGVWNTPPSFSLAPEFQKECLFEWSPDPLFIPSIGCFTKGRSFTLSEKVWDFMDDGEYYSRISLPVKAPLLYKTYRWRKTS